MQYNSYISYDTCSYSSVLYNKSNVDNENTITGYKLGQSIDNKYVVCITILIPKDSVNDINRLNIINKDYSIYNTNKFIISTIEDLSGNHYDNYFDLDMNEVFNKNKIVLTEQLNGNKTSFGLIKERILQDYIPIIRDNKIIKYGIHGAIIKEYILDINNQLDGNYIERHDNNMLKCECKYNNGIITGKYIKFYDNGNKHIECNYNNGLISGKYSEWYRNRQKLIETNYYRGKVDGDLYEWHPNGQIFKFCHYVKDLLNGEYHEYYENGSLYINCTFVNNNLLGTYLKYYNNSNLHIDTYINENNTIDYIKVYNMNGSIINL